MPDRKPGPLCTTRNSEAINSGTLSRQKCKAPVPTGLRVHGLEILTSKGSPELPQWVPLNIRERIFSSTLPHGITRFPGISPWGDILVWINRGALYSDIQVYQEYPSDPDFYLQVARQDYHKGHLLHEVYTGYNRDMRYFVEEKGFSPEMARSEIRRINEELFKLVIEASMNIMTSGAAVTTIATSLRSFFDNPPSMRWNSVRSRHSSTSEPLSSDWPELSGKLRDMLKQKGNFGQEINLGSATREQADAMGKAWVGPKYKITSNGELESFDGLRQYRPPSIKDKLGKVQANFKRRFEKQATREWQTNGHLDIVDP